MPISYLEIIFLKNTLPNSVEKMVLPFEKIMSVNTGKFKSSNFVGKRVSQYCFSFPENLISI